MSRYRITDLDRVHEEVGGTRPATASCRCRFRSSLPLHAVRDSADRLVDELPEELLRLDLQTYRCGDCRGVVVLTVAAALGVDLPS